MPFKPGSVTDQVFISSVLRRRTLDESLAGARPVGQLNRSVKKETTMAQSDTYDLVVIGGGPAGYAAAIRAGQLGKKVACIEMERAGGTCLNWGCIPSKALLKTAETVNALRKADDLGIKVSGDLEIDFEKVIGRSRSVSDKMAGGIEFLFKKNKVEYVRGRGHISVPGIVEVTEGADKGRFFSTRHILIATGCRPRPLPGVEIDGERVMTSREALVMKRQPKSIAIVGAGAIGVEFAYFLNSLGTEVTLIEMLPRIVPVEDDEVSSTLERAFKKQGIKTMTGAKVENVTPGRKSVKMDVVRGDKRESIEVESLLLSIGVIPNLDGLLSSRVKLETDRGYLKVNNRYETSIKGIFAAGDIIGPPWLAHVATFEAVQAVNGIFGHGTPRRVNIFPGCTYCQPQVASVGQPERVLKEKGIEYTVGRFPFTAAGKAVAAGASEGFVKVLAGKKHGEILGAHIIGHDATELIAEFVLAMESELTVDELHTSIHAHPTLSEALGEAAAASFGEAIHI